MGSSLKPLHGDTLYNKKDVHALARFQPIIPAGQSPHTYRKVATYLQNIRHIPTEKPPHTYRPVATYITAAGTVFIALAYEKLVKLISTVCKCLQLRSSILLLNRLRVMYQLTTFKHNWKL